MTARPPFASHPNGPNPRALHVVEVPPGDASYFSMPKNLRVRASDIVHLQVRSAVLPSDRSFRWTSILFELDGISDSLDFLEGGGDGVEPDEI